MQNIGLLTTVVLLLQTFSAAVNADGPGLRTDVDADPSESVGEVTSFPANEPRLTPDEFVIMPWDAPWRWWGPEFDLSRLKEIYDCGFNLAGFVAPEQLDTVQAAGLKAIVYHDADATSIHVYEKMADLTQAEVDQRAFKMVNWVGKHGALYGYYLRDEPGAKLFPVLGRFVDAFRRLDPRHVTSINLFPNYANSSQLQVSTYQEYVDSYISIVQPDCLSYDHYAIGNDGTVSDSYWTNIEAIRTAAMSRGIPFWNIVQSVGYTRWATPSPATLRFQLYTTLAYGARGISYYTYFRQRTDENDKAYHLAPIDDKFERTKTWYYLQDVNMQLHRIGHIYITLSSINVFHHSTVPKGSKSISTARHVQSLKGGDFAVGEFSDLAGHPYIMLVNKSLTSATQFDVTFKQSGTVYCANSATGKLEVLLPETKNLDPGEGVLLTVK